MTMAISDIDEWYMSARLTVVHMTDNISKRKWENDEKASMLDKIPKNRGVVLPAAMADGLARHQAHEQLLYKKKLKVLKSSIRGVILENAALCDTTAKLQQDIVIAIEERRFLTKKLLSTESNLEPYLLNSLPSDSMDDQDKLWIKKLWTEDSSAWNNFVNKNQKHSGNKNGQKKQAKEKKLCPPIALDSTGKPILPMVLGNLILHSLGEVVHDREMYHSGKAIYPVGFCTTRMYASLADPQKATNYTCTIQDGGVLPRFEISSDDENKVFRGATPHECHGKLMKEINSILGIDLLPTSAKGNDAEDRALRFFGFLHPSVQNTVQALPGAKKCNRYKWILFEVSRNSEDTVFSEQEREPSICHETLLRNIRFANNHL